MPKNSLIDTEFVDDDFLSDDPFTDPHEKERAEFESIDLGADDADDADAKSGKTQKPNGKDKNAEDNIEIDIVDDTPNKDKGKWVANPEKDGEPDIPSEEELTSYSEKVQKRLSGMTARIHAERRRAEDKERQLQEAVSIAQRYINENNQLKGVVENGEKVLLGEHKGRLEGQLQAARAAYREAADAGDTNGIIAAQEKIAQAVAAMERLNGHRPQQLERANPEELRRFASQGQNGQQVRPSDRALEWRKNNAWFDSDVPMQAYALAVHQQLAQEGIQLDSDDYYKRIDTEMRRRFPDRFERQNAPRRQPTAMATANRAVSGTPRRVTLTETQVRIAKRLGLSQEQMARQILKEQENGIGKDFTHSKRG